MVNQVGTAADGLALNRPGMPVLIIQILSLIVSLQYYIRFTKPHLSSALLSLISPTQRPHKQRRSDAAPLPLPLRSDRILNNERIGSPQHAIVLNGVADQHPIERIAMQRKTQTKACPPRSYRASRFYSQSCPNSGTLDCSAIHRLACEWESLAVRACGKPGSRGRASSPYQMDIARP
jgi:hypothetical protein